MRKQTPVSLEAGEAGVVGLDGGVMGLGPPNLKPSVFPRLPAAGDPEIKQELGSSSENLYFNYTHKILYLECNLY